MIGNIFSNDFFMLCLINHFYRLDAIINKFWGGCMYQNRLKSIIVSCFIVVFIIAIMGSQSYSESGFKTNNNHSISNDYFNNRLIVINKREVPILCYHQIRDWKSSDGKTTRDYVVPPAQFQAQMKMLHDSGYHAILPDQLYDYLQNNKSLPKKPFMITFDDNDANQFEFAKPVLDKYGFKAVYFVMTVSLNKKNYFSNKQVRQLYDEGNVIGSHTWDHKNMRKYDSTDWARQLDKPRKLLSDIIGKPIEYFAYPFGVWTPASVQELKKRKFKAAFQLYDKLDNENPMYTIRRIIVPGTYSPGTLNKVMQKSFQ